MGSWVLRFFVSPDLTSQSHSGPREKERSNWVVEFARLN
jgi:hypothetical protein